jgi:hypothetical protein
MIIRVRRRLLQAARDLRESGTLPPGVDEPGMYRQRSGWAMVPKEADFWEYLRPQREAFQKVELHTVDGVLTANGTNGAVNGTNGAVHAPALEKQPV